jgi:hypothetical protein
MYQPRIEEGKEESTKEVINLVYIYGNVYLCLFVCVFHVFMYIYIYLHEYMNICIYINLQVIDKIPTNSWQGEEGENNDVKDILGVYLYLHMKILKCICKVHYIMNIYVCII